MFYLINVLHFCKYTLIKFKCNFASNLMPQSCIKQVGTGQHRLGKL